MSTVSDDEDDDCAALIAVISLIGGVSLILVTIVIGLAIKRKIFKFSKCDMSNVSQKYTFIMKKTRQCQPTDDTEDVI